MGIIKAERLQIETQLPVLTLLSFQSEAGMNKHGVCSLKFQLMPGLGGDETGLFRESKLVVRELNDAGEVTGKPIFAGMIDGIEIERTGSSVRAEVSGVTHSILLDRERRQRSFQHADMTYGEIAQKVMEAYPHAGVIWNLDKKRRIEKPVIQYQETDWQFLLRLCSHFHSGILVDEGQEYPAVYAGMRMSHDNEDMEDSVWEYGISPLYYEQSGWNEAGGKDDYIYYVLKRRENRQIGDRVTVRGRNRIILEKRAVFEHGELMFYYKAGTQKLTMSGMKYNEAFRGLRLEGEVAGTEGETVCVRLAIDDSASRPLYPYPWAPATGNLFYCMPEEGTKVYLCFAGADEREAAVVNSIRTNGEDCGGCADSQRRIFETLENKTLTLFPEELALRGNKSGVMPELSLKDGEGAELKSHGSLEMEAEGNIILRAGELRGSAPVGIIQRAAGSNMEIHQDFNLYSPLELNSVHIDLDDRADRQAERRKVCRYTPCWEGVYAAAGALALFGGDMGEATAMGLVGAGGIPAVGGGKAAAAMANAAGGVPEEDNPFAPALQTVKINALNGGYPLPAKIKKNGKRGR